jgi:hypothetical protein
MDKVVEWCLLSKHNALNSNPRTTEKLHFGYVHCQMSLENFTTSHQKSY